MSLNRRMAAALKRTEQRLATLMPPTEEGVFRPVVIHDPKFGPVCFGLLEVGDTCLSLVDGPDVATVFNESGAIGFALFGERDATGKVQVLHVELT